jgi:hypothetical protein
MELINRVLRVKLPGQDMRATQDTIFCRKEISHNWIESPRIIYARENQAVNIVLL